MWKTGFDQAKQQPGRYMMSNGIKLRKQTKRRIFTCIVGSITFRGGETLPITESIRNKI